MQATEVVNPPVLFEDDTWMIRVPANDEEKATLQHSFVEMKYTNVQFGLYDADYDIVNKYYTEKADYEHAKNIRYALIEKASGKILGGFRFARECDEYVNKPDSVNYTDPRLAKIVALNRHIEGLAKERFPQYYEDPSKTLRCRSMAILPEARGKGISRLTHFILNKSAQLLGCTQCLFLCIAAEIVHLGEAFGYEICAETTYTEPGHEFTISPEEWEVKKERDIVKRWKNGQPIIRIYRFETNKVQAIPTLQAAVATKKAE